MCYMCTKKLNKHSYLLPRDRNKWIKINKLSWNVHYMCTNLLILLNVFCDAFIIRILVSN